MKNLGIIVAAGRGSRMEALTDEKPKCLLEFMGRPLIEWQVDALRAAGVDFIIVVTGYRSEMLEAYGDERILNPRWMETNMVYSLMCAESAMRTADSAIIAYADLVYEHRLISALLESKGDVGTIVDMNWRALWEARFEDPLADAETLGFNNDGTLHEIGGKPHGYDGIEGQFIGLSRLTRKGAILFAAEWRGIVKGDAPSFGGRGADGCYFTDMLQRLIHRDVPVRAVKTHGGWLEFDSGGDVDAYEELRRNDKLDHFFKPARAAKP